MSDEKTKKIGEYIEKVNLQDDPNMYLFFKHILAGLTAFSNPQQSAEDSIAKYKAMLRIAEGFLSAKFNFDFSEYRKELEKQNLSEADRLALEIQKIAELLDTRIRKVEVLLRFRAGAVDEEDMEVVAIDSLLDNESKEEENPSDT